MKVHCTFYSVKELFTRFHLYESDCKAWGCSWKTATKVTSEHPLVTICWPSFSPFSVRLVDGMVSLGIHKRLMALDSQEKPLERHQSHADRHGVASEASVFFACALGSKIQTPSTDRRQKREIRMFSPPFWRHCRSCLLPSRLLLLLFITGIVHIHHPF